MVYQTLLIMSYNSSKYLERWYKGHKYLSGLVDFWFTDSIHVQ